MANDFEEFTRSYLGGWGKITLQKSGSIRTFRVLEDNGNIPITPEYIPIEIITARKVTKQLSYTLDYIQEKATWYYPESKYVNTPNFVVRCVAHPQRQYHKVLTLRNCYFADGLSTFLRPIAYKLKQSVLDILDNFDSPYPDYATALELVNSGQMFARAFAKRLLVTLHPEVLYPVLVYKSSFIGFDRGDAIVLNKKSEYLHEIITSASGKGIIYQ
jgi:hypothetical protein